MTTPDDDKKPEAFRSRAVLILSELCHLINQAESEGIALNYALRTLPEHGVEVAFVEAASRV